MANPIITKIQIEGNNVVSFLNGTDYVRSMSQILPQNPTYISYRYDSITISQIGGEAFTFSIYTVTEVGGNTFTELTIQDAADIVQARTVEIYRLLVTSIFKGCCPCGDEVPQCAIQYVVGDPEAPAPLLGEFVYVSGTPGTISFNYITGNNQDFTNFFPTVQDGSWIFLFSKTDPTVYAIIQVSDFTDQVTYAKFTATELNAAGLPFPVGTIFCVDFTSVGGSLVQSWQDTLNISSVLGQDNIIDGGGFYFQWDNVLKYILNSTSFQNYESNDGSGIGTVRIDPGAVTLSGTGYIDIITPNYASASTGWVLALDASGHVEYVEAGTGTISSIELIMPPAFTVSDPNPLTTDGTFTVTVDGTVDQYINGLGELADFPVYTVENGLHAFGGVPGEAPPDPFLFHLGGLLVEDTTITVTNGAAQYALGVAGLAGQNTQQPFGVSNLGDGGVATFQDYGSSSRNNPSVEIVGDVDLYQPLLELRMEGNLPNPNPVLADRLALLRLKYDGDPALAKMSIDYQFKNDDTPPNTVYFIGCRLTAELTDFTANNEQSKFLMQLVDQGSRQTKMEMSGPGQLTLNEYATGSFSNGATNINNTLSYVLGVDNTGKVWKTSAGTGTVISINGAGLITTSPNPITTIGTVTTNMATNRLVGRYSPGSGIMQEITIGAGLALSAGGELTADGSVPVYTVNNGLSPDPGDSFNFQLGGPLVQDTTITGGATPFSHYLHVDNLTGFSLDVNNKGYLISENGPDKSQFIFTKLYASSKYENGVTGELAEVLVGGDSGISSVRAYLRAGTVFGETGIYAGVVPGVVPYTANMLGVTTPNVANGSATVGQVLTLKSMTGSEAGRVEFEDAGGGGTYDSDQGIYKDTSLANDTFMLGAPVGSASTIAFQEAREIDTDIYYLRLFGSNDSRFSNQEIISATNYANSAVGVYGEASDQGYGVKGFSSTGYGVSGEAVDGIGVLGISTNGIGIQAQAVNGKAIYTVASLPSELIIAPSITPGPATTFLVNTILRRRDTPVGGIQIGYGTSLDLELLSNSGNDEKTGRISTSWSSLAVGGTDSADLNFWTRGNAVTEIVGVFKGAAVNGQLQLNKYTSSTAFQSASGASIGVLNVDNAGNVFVGTGGGPSTPYTVNNGLEPQTLPTPDPYNFQLGGSLVRDTTITGAANTHSIVLQDLYAITETAQQKLILTADDGTSSSNLKLYPQNGNTTWDYNDGTSMTEIEMNGAQMFIRTPGFSAASDGDVLTLVDHLTGEVEFQTPAGGGGIPFAVASGTDTYTATVSGVTAYTDGDAYLIRFTNGNTDSATLNINSLGAIPLHQNNQVPLIGGDIWDGGEMLCIYNATDNSFECIGTSPNSLFAYVTNVNGSTITRGQAVIAFGGTGNRMTVKLAQANNDANSAQTIGFVFSTSINDGQKGVIIIQGYFSGLNLFPPASGWADGDPVYLSPTTAGAVTRTKPYAPSHLVYLGVVATASPGSAGRMYVRVQNGYELDELHNVQAQSPNLNDTIRYDTADSQWKTASVPSLSGTFSIGVTVDGSGGTITAGVKGYVRVPYACTINTWSILTGNSGVGATITFDIWRANNAIPTAGSPPLIGAGGTKPFLTSNTSQITSAAPSGWASVTLAANDILGFNVETGAAVFSWANLQLLVTKI